MNGMETPITGIPRVLAVHRSATHTMQKAPCPEIQLLEGLGVEGDAHMGSTVKHRSRVARDPSQPNLRQVHLIHHELHTGLAARGMPVQPGQMGENITTAGLDLLSLPVGTQLYIGEAAIVELTGLRNPCKQLEGLYPGLMAAVLDRAADGSLIRKAGVMGVVRRGGRVRAGDAIVVVLPEGERVVLGVV
jgi:MOSC domain-containing protein YiiM